MPTAARRPWTWDETLLAFRLYCRTPFGRLHQHNPHIIRLATRLSRTPSAVGMKACNFASLDPVLQARGIRGLPNTSKLEQQVWDRFHADSAAIAAEAEAAYERLRTNRDDTAAPDTLPSQPTGPTETDRMVRVRRVQAFFRHAVLVSYNHRCALTGLAVRSLLTASHIMPWSRAPERRADPHNGLCLNALHDRAFDRGLITFDADLRLVLAPALQQNDQLGTLTEALRHHAGQKLHPATRFAPDPSALAYHREHIFQSA